jgi:hypothetical protein
LQPAKKVPETATAWLLQSIFTSHVYGSGITQPTFEGKPTAHVQLGGAVAVPVVTVVGRTVVVDGVVVYVGEYSAVIEVVQLAKLVVGVKLGSTVVAFGSAVVGWTVVAFGSEAVGWTVVAFGAEAVAVLVVAASGVSVAFAKDVDGRVEVFPSVVVAFGLDTDVVAFRAVVGHTFVVVVVVAFGSVEAVA